MSRESLSKQAYLWLKKKIITLEYPMGSALSEHDLCQELNMGRTPIREAIRQLESDGLIAILPRKGTFVSNINIRDFENLLETRVMLETHAIRNLAGNISLEQIETMIALFDDVPELIEQRQIAELLEIDRSFHQGLLAILDNPYLNKIAEGVYDLVTRTGYLSFKSRSNASLFMTLREHLAILEKLKEGDRDAAEKAVRNHIMSFKSNIFH